MRALLAEPRGVVVGEIKTFQGKIDPRAGNQAVTPRAEPEREIAVGLDPIEPLRRQSAEGEKSIVGVWASAVRACVELFGLISNLYSKRSDAERAKPLGIQFAASLPVQRHRAERAVLLHIDGNGR